MLPGQPSADSRSQRREVTRQAALASAASSELRESLLLPRHRPSFRKSRPGPRSLSWPDTKGSVCGGRPTWTPHSEILVHAPPGTPLLPGGSPPPHPPIFPLPSANLPLLRGGGSRRRRDARCACPSWGAQLAAEGNRPRSPARARKEAEAQRPRRREALETFSLVQSQSSEAHPLV